MAGKSIEQVWQKMQAQRQAEMQRQAAQERDLYESRERARQEYLKSLRNIPLFETTTLNPSAAAAAASSAAGAGGGRLTRAQRVNIIESQESVIFWSFQDDSFKYFIYNFQTFQITPIKTISDGYYNGLYPVTNGGFALVLYNDDLSKNFFYFISLTGDIIWQDSNSYGEGYDVEQFSRYIAIYYEKDGIWKLKVVDENSNLREYSFDNYIEGGGYSYDDVWSAGFIVREEISNTYKYHIIRDDSLTPIMFKEYDSLVDTINVYQYAFSDKILTIQNDTLFEVWSSNGDKIVDFDCLTEFSTSNWYIDHVVFLDENGSFITLGYDDDNALRRVILFSGVSDTFTYQSVNGNYNFSYDDTNQLNYQYPSEWHAGGSAIYLFYDSSNSITYGDVEYRNEVKLLPIWGSDESIRNFYTFSYDKGLATSFDDTNVSFLRNSEYINLLIDNNSLGVYYFSDSGSANSIGDGGDDMYDGGNQLYADSIQINYTHTQLLQDKDSAMRPEDFLKNGVIFTGASASVFGESASYFTNLYPGLFVLAAQNVLIDDFKIDGDLGADGGGSVDNYNYQVDANSTSYQVFVKRVYGAQDPSVNHIIIVNSATSSGITHNVGGSTNSDFDQITGLSASSVTEIYYLLTSISLGEKVSDSEVESIVNQFLTIRGLSSDTSELLSNLNSSYETITYLLPERDLNYSILRFNKTGDETTILTTTIHKNSDLDEADIFNDKVVLQFRDFYVSSEGSGIEDLSNVESRHYSSFYIANNENIGNNVLGQSFVMKDIVNDNYWSIVFNWWQGGGGGGFSYTRQLIVGGTFSGDPIVFTHSSYSDEVDIVSEGVLEITRGTYGPIYNRVFENESDLDVSPIGTLWNSSYTNEWQETTHYLMKIDGSQIDTKVTESFNNWWKSNVYALTDNFQNKTYISNSQNDNQFQELNKAYDVWDCANYITTTNFHDDFLLLTSNQNFRIVTLNTITDEFVVDLTGDYQINYQLISKVGVIFVLTAASSAKFLFYDLSGNLVASKTTDEQVAYNASAWGSRSLVIWWGANNLRNYIFFKGDSIEEFSSELLSDNRTTNDWYVN